MGERVLQVGETLLVRQLARESTRCTRQGCPRSGPGPVYVYWWDDEQCGDPPAGITNAYCSQECWAADQYGPARARRLRKWAERFTPGQFTWEGEPNATVRT